MKIDTDIITSEGISPETRVWLACLYQCLRDISGGDTRQRDKASALAWIRDPENPFFQWLSESTNRDPDKFRQRILSLIESGALEGFDFSR
jgi:hypothetical protein